MEDKSFRVIYEKDIKECNEISRWILNNETTYLTCVGLFD